MEQNILGSFRPKINDPKPHVKTVLGYDPKAVKGSVGIVEDGIVIRAKGEYQGPLVDAEGYSTFGVDDNLMQIWAEHKKLIIASSLAFAGYKMQGDIFLPAFIFGLFYWQKLVTDIKPDRVSIFDNVSPN